MINFIRLDQFTKITEKISKSFNEQKCCRLSPFECEIISLVIIDLYDLILENGNVVEIFRQYIALHMPTSFDTFCSSMLEDKEIKLLKSYDILPEEKL